MSGFRPPSDRRRRTKRACNGAGRNTGWTTFDSLLESGLHAGKGGVEARPDACDSDDDNQGKDIPPADQQTPEALAAQQKAEIEKWWPIIRSANLKNE